MSQVTGTIEQKSQREVNTQHGPKQAYSIKVDGEWYSAGFKPCPYEEGQQVNFTYKTNGKYKNIVGYGSAPEAVSTSSGDATAPTPSSGYARAPAKQFPLQADHPDRVIVRQNSLAHATALFTASIGMEESMDTDTAADAIINLAYKFEEYSTGDRETAKAKELIDTGSAPWD